MREENKFNEIGEDEEEDEQDIFHSILQRSSNNKVIEQWNKLDGRDGVCVFFHVLVLQVILCVSVSYIQVNENSSLWPYWYR